MKTRHERLQALREHPAPSVLIIGAGINGIGTFRDLALQGVDVVLVDRGDYCSGASAASSHMIHGGIRYLENGEFGLVKEAVRERNQLIENVPHLVKPLPTTFPIFKRFSGLLNAPLKFLRLLDKPSERGALVIKLGMMLYDAFTRDQKTVPPHIFRNREESLKLYPELNPEILYTATYFDGSMPSPERIAIELIKNAVDSNQNAIPLNYAPLVSAEGGEARIKDQESGEEIILRPKVVVNAAGPWIDLVNGKMGRETAFISGTKGSHLILENPRLKEAIGEEEFFFENKDGRIVLIFPLLDKVMVGSTDIRIENPDEAVIDEEEIDYFFDMIGHVFPEIEVDRSQIIYTFSGVRPLEHTESRVTGQISRDHTVKTLAAGKLLDIPVYSLVGGKWTSFRAFSEQTADMVLDYLGVQRKVSTWNFPIGGSLDYPGNQAQQDLLLRSWVQESGLDQSLLEGLFSWYGTKTSRILADYSDHLKPLETLPELTLGELFWILQEEDVLHLDDLILRRTVLAKLGRISPESLEEIAEICASALDWPPVKKTAEIERFQEILIKDHRMKFSDYVPG